MKASHFTSRAVNHPSGVEQQDAYDCEATQVLLRDIFCPSALVGLAAIIAVFLCRQVNG